MTTIPPPLRLGFAGTPDFAVAALEALLKSQRICAVFTQPDRPAGRGQPLHASPVKALAALHGLPVHQPSSFKTPEVLELLRGLELDALVVVAYGLILPPGALLIPKLGCINIHASLLPRWRGAAPIQHAVLAGDAKTGVTIMRMEAGLDTGPMLSTREIHLGAQDTAGTVHDRLAALGAELIVETLDALARGSVREVPQPTEGVTYAAKIHKADALIDWRQDAMLIARRVRAFNPWPVAETRFDGRQLRIWDAAIHEPPDTAASAAAETASSSGSCPGAALGDAPRTVLAAAPKAAPRTVLAAAPKAAPGTVLAAAPDGIDVACGRGVLRILRLQLAGRKPLGPREFLQGLRLDGAHFAPP